MIKIPKEDYNNTEVLNRMVKDTDFCNAVLKAMGLTFHADNYNEKYYADDFTYDIEVAKEFIETFVDIPYYKAQHIRAFPSWVDASNFIKDKPDHKVLRKLDSGHYTYIIFKISA